MRRSIGVVTQINFLSDDRKYFFAIFIIIFLPILKFILHLMKKYCIIKLVSND